jgi:hypothetical protein
LIQEKSVYIRWKKRQVKKGITYGAYLVYNVRAFGIPQQRVLAYLGCITHCGKDAIPEWQYRHAGQEEAWPAFISHLKKKLQGEVKEEQLPVLYKRFCARVPEAYRELLVSSEKGEK